MKHNDRLNAHHSNTRIKLTSTKLQNVAQNH